MSYKIQNIAGSPRMPQNIVSDQFPALPVMNLVSSTTNSNYICIYQLLVFSHIEIRNSRTIEFRSLGLIWKFNEKY